MSADKLVFDLSSEIEGSPNVFVRKDWLNILDNQNQNYNSNQSVLDTSQLSNSNKYMSYREAYFSMPLTLTLAQSAPSANFLPASTATSADYSFGLKSWFGQIIHSFTLDYNGTTIIQQTPYVNMWNSFKLITSFSYDDVITQGSTIGFYPDDSQSWAYIPAGQASLAGQGTCNNFTATNWSGDLPITLKQFNTYNSGLVNTGFVKRMSYVNYDPAGQVGTGATYATLFPAQSCQNMWKSFIYNKINGTAGVNGILQIAVQATIYLKHIHSFFAMCPLIKGAFLKMTANLNNTTSSISTTINGGATALTSLVLNSVSNPVGGCNPLMFSSASTQTKSGYVTGVDSLFPSANSTLGVAVSQTLLMIVSVGAICLGSGFPVGLVPAPLSKSVYLYIPAYTFNPVFEQAYLSSPIKSIKYTDIYQYQVINVAPNAQFNNLLTNGIANIKSVLILPFYSTTGGNGLNGIPVYQSPFDSAGCGTTSPLSLLGNFNVVVSGQNAIYNQQRYAFEQFNNQLYGQNSVNGGMTDGLTSSLINSLAFESNYCYYYVNVSRMLPVEESVPKSIQIIGTNYSALPLDLYCFIEYGVSVDIDILTGARV
jgi:hypothetical protein